MKTGPLAPLPSGVTPRVAIIIPVYNEARYIRRVLEATLAQDYPRDCIEVWVIDGGSTDDTREIVGGLQVQDERLRLIRNPNRIQSCALNLGIRAAQGDMIVRVDGHSVIARDYVQRCVDYLRTTGADAVGGVQRVVGETPFGCAVAAAYRSSFGVPSRYRTGKRAGYVDTVYLGAWPRAVFERVGYFDETLAVNEDYELNYRIRHAGGRVYLALDIYVEYYGRQSLTDLWRQYFAYGRWKLVMLRKRPASLRIRQTVAPAFVAVLVLGLLLSPWTPWARLGLAVAVGSYVLVNGAASVLGAWRSGWGVMIRLPIVFSCMHLAWGCGFWREALHMLRMRLGWGR